MKKSISLVTLFLLLITNIHAQVFPGTNWLFNEDPGSDGWYMEKMEAFNQYIIDSTRIRLL
jgi:hypothetical protein